MTERTSELNSPTQKNPILNSYNILNITRIFERKELLRVGKNIIGWADHNPIKTIVIVGILLRIIISVLYGHITIYPDSSGYVELAHRILSFDLHGYDGGRSPGYPLLLASVDVSYLGIVALHMLLGVATLVLIYKTLLIIDVRRRMALLLTVMWSCYIPVLFFELALLSEALTYFFVTSIFYIYFGITMQKRTGILSYLLLAFLCMYLVAIKPFYILLPVSFLLFLIMNDNRFRIRTILRKYVVVLVLPAVVFWGWSYVNEMNTGYFTPTTFVGYNMAQNCVDFAEKTTDEYKEIGAVYAKHRSIAVAEGRDRAMSIWDAYDELSETTGLSFVDLSRKLYDYSLATIAVNPGDYIKQVLISWGNFWKTSLYWEYDSFSVPYSNLVLKVICYAERVVLQFVNVLFVLLIPYNIFRSLTRRKYTPQFIISVSVLIVSLAQAFVTFGTNSRFSFPFEALMAMSVYLNYLSYRKWQKSKKQKAESI